MRSVLFFVLILTLLLAACQPAAQDAPALPTLAVLPSATPTDEATLAPTPSNTAPPALSPSSTLTRTPPPTSTTPPSATPTLPDPTTAAAASATAVVDEAPRFITLTPSGSAASTPQVMADLVITEAQFQEALNQQIAAVPSIQEARVSFSPDGLLIDLTALGGQAFITGRVLVSIQLTGTFATLSVGSIEVNAPEPPEVFVQTVTGDFFSAVGAALDAILTERLGEEHDLENIVIANDVMQISLLVPQS